MTVGELKKRLSGYPDDYMVVLDTSRDYQRYSEMDEITPCECQDGFGGIDLNWDSTKPNSVLLT